MSNIILEGESFFVFRKLDLIIKNKKVEWNPDFIERSSTLFKKTDYYIFFNCDKATLEKNNHTNSIFCYPDKNLDLRTDWVKKIKKMSDFYSYEPIPTTDFQALKDLFQDAPQISQLPSKKASLKYKGTKQNYEWFDLMMINDVLSCGNKNSFEDLFSGYVDIWKFTDDFWSGNLHCLKQINLFDNDNFEEYFNKVRETSKDYLELLQTNAKTFEHHKSILPTSAITNSFRFLKVKEKLDKIKKKNPIEIISLFDECLKNVRDGSNAKLELIKIFFEYKTNVI